MAVDLPPNAPEGVPPAAIVAPAPASAEPIFVESHGFHYTVNGNRLLAPAVIVSTVEAAATPKEAVDALNRAFGLAGYPLTAIRGEVSDKLVALQVMHGRITQIDAPPSLQPFLSGVEERDDLQRATLIRRSLQMESFAALEGQRPRLSLAPAPEAGGSKLTVTEAPIEGYKPWSAALNFGNLGSRFSSRYTATASGAVRPGGGMEMSANYTQGLPGLAADSAGAQYQAAAAGFTVTTPWGVYGANYSGVTYKIGESAAPLYPDGTINTGALTGSQLVYADDTMRWGLNQALTWTDNEATVFSGTYPLTQQNYGFVTLGTSVSKVAAVFGENASFGAGLTVLQGMSPRTGTFLPALPGVADPHFTIVQANFSYNQALPKGFSFGFTWSGQWADATVPQNQQWVLGGFGNLSAYLPAVLVGDSGGLGRLNLSTPPVAWGWLSVAGGAFVETGMARLKYLQVGPNQWRGLADAGLSVSGTVTTGTSLTLGYAWPIASHNLKSEVLDALPKANLYFSLNQSF